MNLLYINIGGSLKISSVYKKIFGQVDALNSLGINAKAVFLSPEIDEDTALREHVKLVKISKPTETLFYQIKLQKKYEATLCKIISSTTADIIYLRYSFASKKLLRTIKATNKKIFIERNSLLLPELISENNSRRFKPKIGYILSYYQDFLFPLAQEWYYGKKIDKACDGVICVTNEIKRYYQKKNAKCILIGNGVDTQKYPPRKAPEIHDKILFLILDGTSDNAPWKGTERLIESVISEDLEDKIEIRIAGNENAFQQHPFIRNLGFLSPEEIEHQCNEVHIGTGNLKLYKKNLKEGSVLKNREYASRGLPILLAHNDYDLENSKLSKFSYKVENSDSLIPLKKLIKWLEDLYSLYPEHPVIMHQVSKDVLDFKVKMQQLISSI